MQERGGLSEVVKSRFRGKTSWIRLREVDCLARFEPSIVLEVFNWFQGFSCCIM